MSHLNRDPFSDPALLTLPDTLIEALALSERNCQTLARGRSIIAEGSQPSFAYLVSEGWAVSKLSIGTGQTQIVDILGPGSIVGLTSVTGTAENGYSAIALQDLKLYPINLRILRDLSGSNPGVSAWLIRALSQQISRTRTNVAVLGQLPARGRLAFAMLRILSVAQQLGESKTGDPIYLPMTQEEIGNMLGLTNVSISKLMSAFRREEFIDYGRNRIVVHNVDALSEICGVDLGETAPHLRTNPVSEFSASRRQITG